MGSSNTPFHFISIFVIKNFGGDKNYSSIKSLFWLLTFTIQLNDATFWYLIMHCRVRVCVCMCTFYCSNCYNFLLHIIIKIFELYVSIQIQWKLFFGTILYSKISYSLISKPGQKIFVAKGMQIAILSKNQNIIYNFSIKTSKH